MLSVGILDANEKTNRAYVGSLCSVVSHWIAWECERVGVPLSPPQNAAVLFLCHAGSIDWVENCRGELRRVGIEPLADRRALKPYVIAGGAIDCAPLTALQVADALAVGEAYAFVRGALGLVRDGAALRDLQDWIRAYPHAIEASQVWGLRRDTSRPWLLAETAPALASPDNRVDWSVPPVRSDDKVVRVIGSKGCHGHCLFCSTTWRQAYTEHPNSRQALRVLSQIAAQGQRVSLLSNDPAKLSWYREVKTFLDSESFTIREMRDPANRQALARSGVRMARFGVEGISERLRTALKKPIPDDEILDLFGFLQDAGINGHLFIIPGLPYEADQDWEAFRRLYGRLALLLRRGISRIKFTTYLPTPPAPLARFVPPESEGARMEQFRTWISMNCASRHIHYVAGRRGKQHVRDVAEQLSIPEALAAEMLGGGRTFDLAPRLEEAARLPWEIIQWPTPVAGRWRAAELYRTRLAKTDVMC